MNQSLLERRYRVIGKGAPLFYDEPLHVVRGEGVWLFDVFQHLGGITNRGRPQFHQSTLAFDQHTGRSERHPARPGSPAPQLLGWCIS